MWLYLDLGNSQLKWGLRQGGLWIQRGRLPLTHLDQLPMEWHTFPPLHAAHGVSVAHPDLRAQVESACQDLGLSPCWHSSKLSEGGVRNGYDHPAQLGPDRWMALQGAWHLQHQAALVVMAGTATTLDSLDEKGNFLGGMILPGLTLMRHSLHQGTAHLPAIEQEGTHTLQARSTQDAIQSGAWAATLGALKLARDALSQKGSRVPVFLGGGHHAELSPYLEGPLHVYPELVLEGLALLLEERSGANLTQ
ncbi:type III pantothenate kinase [Ferrovum myxofaciens]|jgi:type III pantothenate kinase|uniref:Type III pantothenate kinase n=2 Tax=root TaxID=1 RepID=A0A859ADG7_9PROT|nr:type III pantothenate kinase [Ferrovum myxofaciens]MBW8028413.1 type III pantothenate kinase [Ferrovum sp.]KXW58882.1 type III pantothenate kinase [Ferrovum myxofaciens]MBU6995275.1 type III pantothenate kinase [Ferrovum myxofaciens]NDU88655.1 type III pantothenate kinase [Ferrovum sp.]QKE39098.1 MAG: type III pantothenate kinase [Ferrovum myxofaciens]